MKISKKDVQASFSNAAASYDQAAVVQSEILERLLEKLELLGNDLAPVLDLGSGTGLAASRLASICGQQHYIALDISEKMLAQAEKKLGCQNSVCADAESLPFVDSSIGMVISASTLQWCNSIERVFSEIMRILKNGGLFIFSSFGPATLSELKACFERTDPNPHVNTFIDMHELGDLLSAFGFSDVVMEAEIITIEYQDPMGLLRDLQATGATNHLTDRSRGLLGRRRLNHFLQEYKQYQSQEGHYPATYEVIYGHGFNPGVLAGHDKAWQPVKFF